MKRYILFLLMTIIVLSSKALKLNVNDLNYSLIAESHEAIISYGNKCSGELDIPSEVSYNGETFVVTSMIWKAFYDCPELISVRIPKTLEGVMHHYPNDPEGDIETILVSSDYMNPFKGCTALESIQVDEENPSLKSVDGVLFSKDGTKLYCYPAGIELIGYIVPEGVTWIGINALANKNLKEIDLPESVQTICHPTFADCALEKVIIRGILDEQSVNSNLFYGLSESAKLYVPASEVERYKALYSGMVLPLEEYNEEETVNFFKGQVATIILPTEPDASKGKYYRLDRVEGKEIVFEQELQPRAHVPYIIVPSEDFSIELGAQEVEGLTGDTVSVEGVSFIGTYHREEINPKEGFSVRIIDTTPDCSHLPVEEQGVSLYVGALRAYLLVHWDDPYNPGGTKAPTDKMEIVLKDNPNSIRTLSNSPLKGEDIYDLSGRKLSTLNFQLSTKKKAIYIQNNRKLVK